MLENSENQRFGISRDSVQLDQVRRLLESSILNERFASSVVVSKRSSARK